MPKQIISTADAPAAIGVYSQAVRAGDTVWVSGQIPLDPQTRELVGGGIEAQIHQVFKNLEAIAHFSTSREVLDYARGLGPITAIEPRLVERDGGVVILVPGDEGYDTAPA